MEFLKSGVAAAAAAGQPVRWAELAAVLKRSPSSLPMKFERLESIVNRAWSKDDDKCLEQYVSEASSSGSGIHWTSIARRLKRTSQATRLRWSSFLDPEMKHGAWSPSESDTLRKLVNEAQLAGRAPRWREWENVIKRPAKELCRYWHVHLRPTSKPSRTPFSLEEDKMIEKMLKEAKENRCNPSWILIGETLGRSRESVRKRARQLNRLAAALQK
ncbi:hypothetical protein DFJ77DRAFT_454635 [Powellomyces hirtus]|nr:hypothetical protein DFJ77DRAFT_454635 [Powellomyces hirtus]